MVRNQEPLIPIDRVAGTPAMRRGWETVDAAVERYLQWMAEHPNRAARTTENAGFQLDRFREFVHEGQRVGDLALDCVPSTIVQAYQRSMVDAETSPNTITVYMARVSAFFTWTIETEARQAREQRREARELFTPVIGDLLHRKTRRRDRVLTVDEVNRLIAATPDPLLWFVGCGVFAGLRAGETIHLRPNLDVDLEVGTITIREKDGIWKPKTPRSKRLVPMAPALLEIARAHADRYAGDAWMMPSPIDASLPISDLAVRKHFIPVVERTGMVYGRAHPQGVTYHTLRHSFASHAVMRGVDLYTVAKLLGDSLKMVEDVYADLSPDHKRAAVAKLAGAFTLGASLNGALPESSESVTAGVTENA